jgi:tetratricopeptide (TPR) repeat protein
MSAGDATREALDIMVSSGDDVRRYAAHVNLGGFAFYAGRWDEAVQQFGAASAAATKIGDVVSAAIVDLNVGEVLASQRHFDEAQAVLDDAMRVLRVAGASHAAYGAVHQARVLLGQGRADEAERMARQAELDLTAFGQRVSALEALLVKSEALTTMGRAEESLTVLAASDSESEAEAAALQPRVHLERARALLALERLDETAAELTAGIELADQYGIPYERAQLLLLQAELLQCQGDAARSSASTQEALEILAPLGVQTPAA